MYTSSLHTYTRPSGRVHNKLLKCRDTRICIFAVATALPHSVIDWSVNKGNGSYLSTIRLGWTLWVICCYQSLTPEERKNDVRNTGARPWIRKAYVTYGWRTVKLDKVTMSMSTYITDSGNCMSPRYHKLRSRHRSIIDGISLLGHTLICSCLQYCDTRW